MEGTFEMMTTANAVFILQLKSLFMQLYGSVAEGWRLDSAGAYIIDAIGVLALRSLALTGVQGYITTYVIWTP